MTRIRDWAFLYYRRTLPPLELELVLDAATTNSTTIPAPDSSTALPARLRFVPTQLVTHSTAAQNSNSNSSTTTTRLHEIIQRIGEICLTPELALVMLFPAQAHQAHLLLSENDPPPSDSGDDTASTDVTDLACFDENIFDLCHNKADILDCMGTPIPPDIARLSRAFLDLINEQCLPNPTLVTLPHPVHVCAWNVQSPPRVILYTGAHPPIVKPQAESHAFRPPHTLQKVLLDERSKRETPSSIVALDQNSDDLTVQAIRNALLAYYHAQNQSYDTITKHTTVHTQDHTLEEAAVVFATPPDRNHSTIQLNQSPPWDKDHIDSRYAETQTAVNGLRYRDWVCVFADDSHLEKCKLEGHVLDITQFHQALVPWHNASAQKKEYTNHEDLQWAVSRSSLPLEQRVLHDRPNNNNNTTNLTQPAPTIISQFTAFTRSVKARLLQDIKLLPVPSPLHTVDRLNVAVYTDEPSSQVLVVYAPTSEDPEAPNNTKLEFVSFTLLL